MSYDGLTAEELCRVLGAPRCECFESVGSTLDVVHRLAADGAPAGTIVLADEQVAGRGRRGRRWLSPPRTGIWLGFLARPNARPESGVMALRVGLAVVESLGDLGAAAQLKWPNDVVLCDRKLGGILCEARWRESHPAWVALGIGLNVHGPLPEGLVSEAAVLEEALPEVTRLAVLERLVPRLGALHDAAELDRGEVEMYGKHDWLKGRRVTEPMEGVARGVAPDGALLVETEVGLERIVGGGIVAA